MIIQDDGGGTLSICDITPQDVQGQIDNILTRLTNLENTVSQMLGGDITANQLSDIAQNVGWVYDVTYLGVTGWTQTQAGTLIPPTGVSLSSLGLLGPNNGVFSVYDSDGNVVQSWDTSGTSTGGGGGGITDYIVLKPNSTTLSFGFPDLVTFQQSGTAFDDTYASTGNVYLNETGLYIATANFVCNLTSTPGTSYMWLSANNVDGSSNTVDLHAFTGARNTIATWGPACSMVFNIDVGASTPYVNVKFSGVSALNTTSYGALTLAKLN